MRTSLKLVAVLALAIASVSAPLAERLGVPSTGPTLSSIGPLAFGPDGILYAADRQAATIFALDLGAQATGGAPGTKDVAGVDQQIAALLGTAAAEIAITDLVVHPTTKNSFVAVMRGQGTAAQPALLRIDGAGKITMVNLEPVKFTSVALPNPPAVSTSGRGGRSQSITDMAYVNGRIYVAGLSNEEFASKLWSVAYPFAATDRGASVETYHGNHGRLETNAPVMSFVAYTIANEPHIVAGYTCTPLVKFPVSALKPGEKVLGTTMAELGAGNQPIDMVIYKKDGQDFLLLANTRHGVMKIPTSSFATAQPITARVGGTAGTFERIASMTGVEQLDLLDAQRSIVITRGADGARNLTAIVLP
jgi:hypothetical protein